jgi:hypothetical protein
MGSLDSDYILSEEVIARFDFIQKRKDAPQETYKNFEDFPLPDNYKQIIEANKNSDKLHAF